MRPLTSLDHSHSPPHHDGCTQRDLLRPPSTDEEERLARRVSEREPTHTHLHGRLASDGLEQRRVQRPSCARLSRRHARPPAVSARRKRSRVSFYQQRCWLQNG